MKKVTLLGVVFILLAVSVVPVMAANGGSNGHGNGHGNGVGLGQNNPGGDQDQVREQVKQHTQNGNTNRGAHGSMRSLRSYTPFYLQGRITDVGPNTLTVDVIHASASAKDSIGISLTVQITSTTVIYKLTQGVENTTSAINDEGTSSKVIIPLAQLEVGKIVAIHGYVANEVYTARLITEYIGNFLGAAAGTP